MNEHDEDVFVMTPWGCLFATLSDYGIDMSNITPTIGQHMVEDFMNAMVKAGHIGLKDNDDNE